jgi:lipid II:glycine glycyltransferase (peptidoglycan interpeptide bridge formation enzyme)
MEILNAQDQAQWDAFLSKQKYSPFMQSWTMGEVYRDIGEEPIRLEMREGNELKGICQALVINARRGKHLVVPYGPIINNGESVTQLIDVLKEEAIKHKCCFIRLSPFWKVETDPIPGSVPAPHHLLAEHIWYINLKNTSEEEILKNMRKNTRNLIRRAGKDGVTIKRSEDPLKDLDTFIELHEETRKRHSFTPYTNTFFKSQVEHFFARGECTMYQAHYEGEVIASSIHMHAYGETSYHHGASTHKHRKIPASYLLQWTAIQDALKRGDHMYSFWGIAPEGVKKHPFAGVTLFKRGFGGELLELTHCMDVPVNSRYYLTRAFENYRKWRRGF